MLNLPKKLVSTIHVLLAFALIIVSVAASFMPIITLETGTKEADLEKVEELWLDIFDKEMGKDLKKALKEPIGISAPKLISMIGIVVDMVNALSSSDDAEEILEELENVDPETLATAVALLNTFASLIDIDEEDIENGDGEEIAESVISMIFNIVITYICLIWILIATLVLPVIYVFLALFALFSVLRHVKDLSGATTGVCKKLPGKISIPMTVILFQCVLPTMHYGSGTMLLWVMALVTVLLNVLATRAHSYDRAEFKYLNVVQGMSLLGIIGYVVFFFSIIKTGIFTSFTGGAWGTFVTKVAVALEAGDSVETTGYIVDAIMMIVYVALVLSSLKYFNKCLKRISCTLCSAKRESDPKDSFIVKAIFMLLIYILPTVVAGSENCLKDPTKSSTKGAVSSLVMSSDAKSALTVAFVGIIIIVVAEIALIVLKKVFCSDVSTESKVAVMSGTAYKAD